MRPRPPGVGFVGFVKTAASPAEAGAACSARQDIVDASVNWSWHFGLTQSWGPSNAGGLRIITGPRRPTGRSPRQPQTSRTFCGFRSRRNRRQMRSRTPVRAHLAMVALNIVSSPDPDREHDAQASPQGWQVHGPGPFATKEKKTAGVNLSAWNRPFNKRQTLDLSIPKPIP